MGMKGLKVGMRVVRNVRYLQRFKYLKKKKLFKPKSEVGRIHQYEMQYEKPYLCENQLGKIKGLRITFNPLSYDG